MERIVTERLTLEPMCCAEMAAHAAACREADPELSAAYREMLDGCRANPPTMAVAHRVEDAPAGRHGNR